MAGVSSTGHSRESQLNKAIATSGTTTLSADEARNGILRFTATLVGNANVEIPLAEAPAGARWTVENATTGAFTLTVQTVGGSGVNVAQGFRTAIISTGTNLEYLITDLSGIGSGAGDQEAAGFRQSVGYTLLTDGAGPPLDISTTAEIDYAILEADLAAATEDYAVTLPTAGEGMVPGRHWIIYNADTQKAALITVDGQAAEGVRIPPEQARWCYVDGGTQMRPGHGRYDYLEVNLDDADIDYRTDEEIHRYEIVKVNTGSGSQTAARSLIVPDSQGQIYRVWNNVTESGGPHGITVKTAAGTGISIATTKIRTLFSDGTNIYSLGADNDPTA